MDIHIIGGCYREVCHWPNSDIVMGSGGRAARLIAELSQSKGTHLHSLLPTKFEINLKQHFVLVACEFHIENINELITFEYLHPLSVPEIYPSRNTIGQKKVLIDIEEDNVLVYGMLESDIKIKAKKLVYDPQDSVSPLTLQERQFDADSIALILNHSEAVYSYTKLRPSEAVPSKIEELVDVLFDDNSVEVVVIKNGHRGAFVKERNSDGEWVSAYKTDSVYPIGSGDCYAAAFAYYWSVEQIDAITAAKRASIVAAFYCDTKTYPSADNVLKLYDDYSPLASNDLTGKSVYLAGPFFNLKEIWMVNQARLTLNHIGLTVFSPYHDVGVGTADQVVHKDIEAIENSDVIYALFDDHDPGTLFEIGYAVKIGIPVVIYTETSSKEHLKMFEGMGCKITTDFATSIYHTCWALT